MLLDVHLDSPYCWVLRGTGRWSDPGWGSEEETRAGTKFWRRGDLPEWSTGWAPATRFTQAVKLTDGTTRDVHCRLLQAALVPMSLSTPRTRRSNQKYPSTKKNFEHASVVFLVTPRSCMRPGLALNTANTTNYMCLYLRKAHKLEKAW